MKDLTIDVCNTVMEFLLLTFGSTTTLDVKDNLRKLGFSASQKEVSDSLNEIYEDRTEGLYSPYTLDDKEVTLTFETKTENRVSFRVYSWSPVEVEDENIEVEDDVVSFRDYIAANINTPSDVLAAKLGITKGSVASYKANISRSN